jgi:hypothetical protein
MFGSTNRVTPAGLPKVPEGRYIEVIEGFLRLRSLLPRRSSPGLFCSMPRRALWAKVLVVNESRGHKSRG